MACKHYTDCESCEKYKKCPYDHYGDGSPWCIAFECGIKNCKRNECISYEEQLFEYMNY